MKLHYSILSFLSLLLWSCQTTDKKSFPQEEPLAMVYDKGLYPSDLVGIFPYAATAIDSNLIIKSFVNRWVKEMLFLHEAEQNINPQINIEKLVQDYRSSLLRASYEKEFVNNTLDSTVTSAQLSDFYEASKEQFILETPIVRFLFLKLPEPILDERKLRRELENADDQSIESLRNFALEEAETVFLELHVWKDFDQVTQLLPPGVVTPSNISYKKYFSKRFEGYLYLLKILEYREAKTIAPLSYVEGQAKKIILHNRKVEILNQKKEALLLEALRRQNVQFYY
ncbi:MAG: hypothetical protein ACO388_02310 [Saprospiraceae bacterium]